MLYNPFSKHPKENGYKSYLEHGLFAFGVGFRLLLSAKFFIWHALLPFIPIPSSLNFDKTILYLEIKRNESEAKQNTKAP
jgi:hypothetical protein